MLLIQRAGQFWFLHESSLQYPANQKLFLVVEILTLILDGSKSLTGRKISIKFLPLPLVIHAILFFYSSSFFRSFRNNTYAFYVLCFKVNHIREGGGENELRMKYLNLNNPIQLRCVACNEFANRWKKNVLNVIIEKNRLGSDSNTLRKKICRNICLKKFVTFFLVSVFIKFKCTRRRCVIKVSSNRFEKFHVIQQRRRQNWNFIALCADLSQTANN